ncbi:DUF2493 domain-containing protein [Rhodococcus hoagii]|nr:DUF2493 domain-containing protein [Prescottella equi]NKZ84593.1 DUF2493 domain-containing protein [Prescottella equi]
MTRRILVTGSRDWTDRETIGRALLGVWCEWDRPLDTVLVHGDCHLGGADAIAAEIWAKQGFPVEPHPAKRDPVTGRVLGPQRNAKMVALGADICLAFPLPSSRGTRNCIRLAREAGIPTRIFNHS